MRLRTLSSLVLLLFVFLTTSVLAPAAFASAPVHLAQGDTGEGGEGGDIVDEEEESQTQDEQDAEGEGQSDPDAESGAGEEAAEGEATEEEGPPWTYQMVWITIVLTLLVSLLLARLYYKMIVSRQRGAG